MKILLVDIGNTNTKLKYNDSEEIITIQTSDKYTPEILEMLIPKISSGNVDGVIVSSVVPKATLPIKKFLKDRLGLDAMIVSSSTYKGYIKYPTMRDELGSDMFSSTNGIAKDESTFLSIDCGTACTFNLIIDRNYIGTSIAPGLASSHRSLITNASLIQYVNLDSKSIKLLAQNTEDCVRSGSILGWSFMIDGFINAIKEEYKLDNLKVFLTGGTAHLVFPHLKNEVILSKNLVFKGLESLYELNKEEK